MPPLTLRQVFRGAVDNLRSRVTRPADDAEARLDICLSCEYLSASEACKLCGCPVRALVRLEDKHCAINKW